jgi:hypothetical protein
MAVPMSYYLPISVGTFTKPPRSTSYHSRKRSSIGAQALTWSGHNSSRLPRLVECSSWLRFSASGVLRRRPAVARSNLGQPKPGLPLLAYPVTVAYCSGQRVRFGSFADGTTPTEFVRFVPTEDELLGRQICGDRIDWLAVISLANQHLVAPAYG